MLILGQMLILGRLRALGYHMTRDRLRQAIRSKDPLNNALQMPRGFNNEKDVFSGRTKFVMAHR